RMGRRRRTVLILGTPLVLALAAGLVYVSAASLTVSPKNASTFRTCIVTGYPTTSTAIADAYVDENAASANNGTPGTLNVSSRTTGQNRRAHIRFDLAKCTPALAATATVRQATLRLNLSAAGASTARVLNLSRVDGTSCPEKTATPSITTCWTEAGIKWNNKPSVASTPSATLSLAANAPKDTYYTWTVTSDVATFVAGPASNYGWQIADSVENTSAGSMNSTFKAKELGTDAAGAPQLVVVYAP
ncbi:MAG TPA: DNRLRE domain-containing protein, partial [Acidimicrobiia bacterium]|nr:DNRLRE domain-containing protein [Acidimicrobiia bacterium]